MIPLGPVVARLNAQAERATVWAYLVSGVRRALWWPELELAPRIGGAVSERWAEGEGDERVSRDASGDVDVVVPEHALGFRWKEAGDARTTAVLITLRTLDDGTAITVTETGFDSLTDAAARAAASQEGWNILLRDLAAAAEADTGEFPEDEGPGREHDAEPAPQPAEEPVDTTGLADVADASDSAGTADLGDTADTAETELELSVDEGTDAEIVQAEVTDVVEAEVIDEEPEVPEEREDAEPDVIDAEPEVVIAFDDLIRGPR